MNTLDKYLSKTREEILYLLGTPNKIGGASRKYRTPMIYSYDGVEYHFQPWKNGECVMIFDNNTHKVLAKKENNK